MGATDRERLAAVLDGKTDPEDLHALYEEDEDDSRQRAKSAVNGLPARQVA